MKHAKRFLVFLLAAVACAVAPQSSAQSKQDGFYEHSYALVVGISNYAHEDWHKNANAENDARGIAEFLGRSGFKVVTLYNEQATKKAIEDSFITIAKEVGENDAVLVYFAGHGATEQFGDEFQGYIVPYDATKGEISSYIDMADIKKYSGNYMRKAKHQLFIMDSCYGGTLGREGSTRAGKPKTLLDTGPRPPDFLKEITQKYAREVLTAGQGNEQVVDGGGTFIGHSLFTGYLLKALEGAAGAGDGYITFSQLVTYILKNATIKGQQTPYFDTLDGHQGGRDFVFVLPNSIRRKIAITPVFEPQGQRTEQNDWMKTEGGSLLLEKIQFLQGDPNIRTVDFELSGASQALQTRSDKDQNQAPRGNQPDYVMQVKYWRLDSNRFRVEAQFTKNKEDLPPIDTQRAEVNALDFTELAQKILRPFSSSPDLQLHLQDLHCSNCKPEMEGAIEPWLSQLSVPGIKYASEKGTNSATDVNLRAIMSVSSEGNRSVFTVNFIVTHAGDPPKIFPASGDAGQDQWTIPLKKVQGQIETYLATLVKQN